MSGEANEAYYKSIREWNEIECSIDFTNYLPKEIPEDLVKDIIKKSPDITELKFGYEIACHYWRVRCEADEKCLEVKRTCLINYNIKLDELYVVVY